MKGLRYSAEVTSILELALSMFVYGFDYQKGAIFGFGPSAAKDTGNVLKISDVDEETIKKLDNSVQVHNIPEERNVGSIGYGLGIRGKDNLNTVSRKHVLNRSGDLVKNVDASAFKQFRKKSTAIREIKLEWNNK